MREYPLFIPFEDHHLAIVIAVPDGQPAGLVALITGGPAGRSHRYQLWTRAARRLAEEHGLASVRLDYVGSGDSTGSRREWLMSEPPVEEVGAAIRFAMDAVGTDRVATMGNCLGSEISLQMAAEMPQCVGAYCIRHPVLAPGMLSSSLIRARRTTVASLARSNPVLKKAIRPLIRRQKRMPAEFRARLTTALRHGRVEFLYSRQDLASSPLLERKLNKLARALPPELRGRMRVEVLPGGGLQGFESIEVQQAILDRAGQFLGETFSEAAERGAGSPAGTPAPASEPGQSI